jgi:hypothetical protein
MAPRTIAGLLTYHRNVVQVALSQPMQVDLVVYRGDSGTMRVTVTTIGGVPVDISGATWDCDIRTSVDDPTTVANMTVTPVAGTVQSVDVFLTALNSAQLDDSYVWDLQMTLAGEVKTLLAGTVTVVKDVSRTP